MAVAQPHDMKMIMTQLMLDDFLRLLHAKIAQLMRADLDMMGYRKITSARRLKPAVKCCFVQKRPAE
ncbi:hypothetical protein D3C85_1788740 [compost metagenome]